MVNDLVLTGFVRFNPHWAFYIRLSV